MVEEAYTHRGKYEKREKIPVTMHDFLLRFSFLIFNALHNLSSL